MPLSNWTGTFSFIHDAVLQAATVLVTMVSRQAKKSKSHQFGNLCSAVMCQAIVLLLVSVYGLKLK